MTIVLVSGDLREPVLSLEERRKGRFEQNEAGDWVKKGKI